MSMTTNVEHSADKKLVVTFPPWAERISVADDGERLQIRGDGRLGHYPRADELIPARDLLREYRNYAGMLDEKRTGKRPAHVQFANANTEQKLVAFVERYGPVWASAPPKFDQPRRGQTTIALEVVERWDLLRLKQNAFSSVMRLVGEVQEGSSTTKSRVAQQIYLLYRAIVDYRMAPGLAPEIKDDLGDDSFLMWYSLKAEESAQSEQAVIDCAHFAICHVLDKFRPVLVPSYPKALELPERQPEGVLPALVWMLRQDYLLGRKLHLCIRPACGEWFSEERSGSRFCSTRCSRLFRQREYWHRKGRQTRIQRQLKLKAQSCDER